MQQSAFNTTVGKKPDYGHANVHYETQPGMDKSERNPGDIKGHGKPSLAVGTNHFCQFLVIPMITDKEMNEDPVGYGTHEQNDAIGCNRDR